ncbi:hypothetical protein Snoj_46410 [Streptomyces nojiriensis]|uniref:Uncharacterized protein n=1 Tax=Streptomyces nojiriensis TaxID=66374 RepID=A0ABQ3SRF5_9ACTN|nr:hypothetical protein [Streptomyces nojiriensis]QTI44280.1 hypothetical protein JYK04_02047 [Streptomyces nojiriensis]GGS36991.1 hypothetical protein GCM10010205_78740 [Streptomyces nojiriensis]GHI70723.1 hypothetical protein Snoj_46410 [Streptomyces nojiriensis]
MPADRPVALDEYPIHQAPLSMKHVVSGDRNAYDRCIFHVFDHAGRAVLILGLGVYPNAGVIDAYATLRIGDELLAVRASDALGDDRMNLSVGPLSITVDVPLKQLTLRCAADPADPHGLSCDITWTAEFPAVWEPHHVQRRGDRLMLEGRRFVQAGQVTGTIRAKGEEFTLTPGEWTGTRDRSWGVRPIPGEEGGRAAEEYRPEGFHWLWIPVRFEDRFVMVIAQEDADGHRTLNEAVQVFPEGSGRHDVQLGWPHTEIRYRPGSRHPERAVVHLTDPSRKPLELGVEILNSSPLAVGAGYPPAGDWQHGTWQGRGWSDRRVYDLSDPAAHPMAAFGVTDHSARFILDGRIGHGIFEHGSFGRHDPSGFADYSSVAQ